jgi:hypothetical protein
MNRLSNRAGETTAPRPNLLFDAAAHFLQCAFNMSAPKRQFFLTREALITLC